MEQSEKEKQFAIEYKALLDKYNVHLVIETSSDEYGAYATPSFRESGRYCNINYIPDYSKKTLGYCGMGR